MSLAQISLPGVGEISPSPTTVGDHEALIRETMRRNVTPSGTVDNVTSHHSEPITLDIMVEAMIFHDKIDVLYNRSTTARRKRHEWPSFDEGLVRTLARAEATAPAISEEVIQMAKDVVDFEISQCENNPPLPQDMVIELYCAGVEQRLDLMLKVLYRRAREQSAVWDVFDTLHRRGFVTVNSLRIPIKPFAGSKGIYGLLWLLTCFSGRTTQRKQVIDAELEDELYDVPEAWLATMIVRGCADIDKLLDTILATGYLGELDEEAYGFYLKNCEEKHFSCNPLELAAETVDLPNSFGFWLPHGIKGDSVDEWIGEVRKHIQQFNRIEEAYKAYFALSDDELLLEQRQESYFRRPSRLCSPVTCFPL